MSPVTLESNTVLGHTKRGSKCAYVSSAGAPGLVISVFRNTWKSIAYVLGCVGILYNQQSDPATRVGRSAFPYILHAHPQLMFGNHRDLVSGRWFYRNKSDNTYMEIHFSHIYCVKRMSIPGTLKVIEKPWMFSACTKKDASHWRTDLGVSPNEPVGGHLYWEYFWSPGLKKPLKITLSRSGCSAGESLYWRIRVRWPEKWKVHSLLLSVTTVVDKHCQKRLFWLFQAVRYIVNCISAI